MRVHALQRQTQTGWNVKLPPPRSRARKPDRKERFGRNQNTRLRRQVPKHLNQKSEKTPRGPGSGFKRPRPQEPRKLRIRMNMFCSFMRLCALTHVHPANAGHAGAYAWVARHTNRWLDGEMDNYLHKQTIRIDEEIASEIDRSPARAPDGVRRGTWSTSTNR